jgi:Fe-S cluster biogenesis protein NfuA
MSSSATSPTTIGITAEPSRVDPNSVKLVVDRAVAPGGPHLFTSAAAAAGSPLPERLFALAGVAQLLIADNVVSVTKTPASDWQALLRPLGQIIREQLLSGVPTVVTTSRPRHDGPVSDGEISRIVAELLEREVNPQIAGHGGKISLVRVEKGTVYVKMGGGCQGCAASTVTLRHGMEVIVHRVLPDVTIVDATDHAAGRKPFFSVLPEAGAR